MNAFQKCVNTSDVVPLYLPQQLFLKPIARMNITVQLTQKMLGKTIMHHEVMEKLRDLIRPDEFTLLKVTKTTIEMVRFEAEVELKNKVSRVVSKLDNKMIKLKDFKELMKVRAAEPKLDFPTRREWDAYFQDAKDMNEMKPGERPDTVHLSNLPTKWFVAYNHRNSDDLYPSEKIFYHTFEKFGSIRMVDIPICDPYRSKMKSHITGIQTSSFEETDFFEGYIQFKDYIGFSKCMDCLRGMKLLHKDKDENYTINVYVTFDKTKHLSEGTLRRREIVRDRLIFKQKDKEEKEKQVEEKKKQIEQLTRQQQLDIQNGKEKRRREREEKRKAKILAELKVKGTDDISDKIAKEERKLVKVQRRLEAIRLVEELFKRIKTKIDKNIEPEIIKSHKTDKVSKMKMLSEYKVKTQQEKLHSAIEGRVILKSIISKESKNVNESSSDSDSSLISDIEESVPNNVYAQPLNGASWYDYLHTMPSYNMQPYCPPRHFPPYFSRGRGNAGPSRFPYNNRPYNNRGRGRGAFNHYIQQEYYKYAQDAINREPRYRRRSYSRSRSHSRHRTRSRSYSRSKSRSYSRNRSKSRDRRTRSRSVSSRRSHRRSRSHSRATDRRGRSHSRATDRRSRSHSRAADRRSRSKSRNRSRTRDASFKNGRSRSRRRSSSKDKNNEGNRRSWSRSRGDSKTKNKP